MIHLAAIDGLLRPIKSRERKVSEKEASSVALPRVANRGAKLGLFLGSWEPPCKPPLDRVSIRRVSFPKIGDFFIVGGF
jgi:hypothetical protein